MAVIQPRFDPTQDPGTNPVLAFMSSFMGERSSMNKQIMMQRMKAEDPAVLSGIIQENQKAIAKLSEIRARMMEETESRRAQFVTDMVVEREKTFRDLTKVGVEADIEAMKQRGMTDRDMAELRNEQFKAGQLSPEQSNDIDGYSQIIVGTLMSDADDASKLRIVDQQIDQQVARIREIQNPYARRAAMEQLYNKTVSMASQAGLDPTFSDYATNKLYQQNELIKRETERGETGLEDVGYGVRKPAVSRPGTGVPGDVTEYSQAQGATSNPPGSGTPSAAASGGSGQMSTQPRSDYWREAVYNIGDADTSAIDTQIKQLQEQNASLMADINRSRQQGPVGRMFQDFERNYMLETPFKRDAPQTESRDLDEAIRIFNSLSDEMQLEILDTMRSTPQGPDRIDKINQELTRRLGGSVPPTSEQYDFSRTPVVSPRSTEVLDEASVAGSRNLRNLSDAADLALQAKYGEERNKAVNNLILESSRAMNSGNPVAEQVGRSYIQAIDSSLAGERGDFDSLSSSIMKIRKASEAVTRDPEEDWPSRGPADELMSPVPEDQIIMEALPTE